jgi:hypothetical protein
MRRRIAGMLAGLVILTALVILSPVQRVRADIAFCGGLYGVQVWTAFNYTGTSVRFCADAAGNISKADMANYGIDNAISSVQVRNQPTGPLWYMSLYTGYSYTGSRCRLEGNDSVPDMRNCDGAGPFNNVVSSLRKTAT